MSCCVCGAEDFSAGWERWDDHPARRQWDVIKDLGSGAMAQVCVFALLSPVFCVATAAGRLWRSGNPVHAPPSLPAPGDRPQVVLARNRQTGEMAALKVVFLQSPAVVDDPEHLELLKR